MKSILIISQFCICAFTYLLKFIFNPQINTVSKDIHRCAQTGEKVSCPMLTFPTRLDKATPCLLVSAPIPKQMFLLWSTKLPAISFTLLYFLLVILLFKKAHKHRTEILSSVPAARGSWCALWRKRSVLEKHEL